MAYPHKRHRFQKFIVFLFAIVIILLVSYFVALPKIKTKATGIVAEKLLESQITSDTSAIAGVNAQEILDAMSDTDRATVDQIIKSYVCRYNEGSLFLHHQRRYCRIKTIRKRYADCV